MYYVHTNILLQFLAKSQVFGFQKVPFFMAVFLIKESFDCI